MIIRFITTFAIGVICIILGILNMMGNIASLHSYHRSRVTEENRAPFGRLVGLGTIIIGVAIIALGIFLILTEALSNYTFMIIGSIVFGAGFIIGFAMSIYAMIKYNHGIF